MHVLSSSAFFIVLAYISCMSYSRLFHYQTRRLDALSNYRMDILLIIVCCLSEVIAKDVVVPVQQNTVVLRDQGCGNSTHRDDKILLPGTSERGHVGPENDVEVCSRLTIESGRQIFGLDENGGCVTWMRGSDQQPGNLSFFCPENGLGTSDAYHVYSLENVPKVSAVNLGCWNDKEKSPAIAPLPIENKVSGTNLDGIVELCARAALARKYTVFAIQNESACYTSATAHLNYDNYGKFFEFCPRHGRGAMHVNNVYVLKERIAGFQTASVDEVLNSTSIEEDFSGDEAKMETFISGYDPCQGNPCDNGWCHTIPPDGYNCTCQIGFKLDPVRKTCVDLNECTIQNMCINARRCENRVGTYLCVCERGFKLDRVTRTCVDINECETGNHVCKFNADCENTNGHYKCKCKQGLEGNGITSCKLDPSFAKEFAIECHADKIKLHVPLRFIKMFGKMHLSDPSCHGTMKPKEWLFMISDDLSECGMQISMNQSHLFYKNTLTNRDFLASDPTILSGTPLFVDWMCVYPKNNLPVKLVRGKSFLSGAGILRIGTADENGEYPESKDLPPYIRVQAGGILSQTDPSGNPVTDVYGDVIPQRNPDTGEILTGPDGGYNFIPVTNAQGLPKTGTGGNIVPVRNKDGSLATPPLPTYPPGIKPYDPDAKSSLFEGSPPDNFDLGEKSPVIGSEEIAGAPELDPIQLANGSIVIPGINETLPGKIEIMLEKDESKDDLIIREPEIQQIHLDNVTGYYKVSLWPFTDETYMTVRTKFLFDTQELLHLRVMVDTVDVNMVVVIETCWGTAKEEPGSSPSQILIDNGCAVSGAVQDSIRIISNGEWRTADFRTQMFSFRNFNTTFIHCQVDLCNKKITESCRPNCESDTISRKKRGIGSNEQEIEKSQKAELTLGPLYARKPIVIDGKSSLMPSEIPTTTSPQNSEPVGNGIIAAIIFVSLVNILILLIVCGCSVYCIRRRRNRKNCKKENGVQIGEGENLVNEDATASV